MACLSVSCDVCVVRRSSRQSAEILPGFGDILETVSLIGLMLQLVGAIIVARAAYVTLAQAVDLAMARLVGTYDENLRQPAVQKSPEPIALGHLRARDGHLSARCARYPELGRLAGGTADEHHCRHLREKIHRAGRILTAAEKRQRVLSRFAQPDAADLSDRTIARELQVSQPFVSKLRTLGGWSRCWSTPPVADRYQEPVVGDDRRSSSAGSVRPIGEESPVGGQQNDGNDVAHGRSERHVTGLTVEASRALSRERRAHTAPPPNRRRSGVTRQPL